MNEYFTHQHHNRDKCRSYVRCFLASLFSNKEGGDWEHVGKNGLICYKFDKFLRKINKTVSNNLSHQFNGFIFLQISIYILCWTAIYFMNTLSCGSFHFKLSYIISTHIPYKISDTNCSLLLMTLKLKLKQMLSGWNWITRNTTSYSVFM